MFLFHFWLVHKITILPMNYSFYPSKKWKPLWGHQFQYYSWVINLLLKPSYCSSFFLLFISIFLHPSLSSLFSFSLLSHLANPIYFFPTRKKMIAPHFDWIYNYHANENKEIVKDRIDVQYLKWLGVVCEVFQLNSNTQLHWPIQYK